MPGQTTYTVLAYASALVNELFRDELKQTREAIISLFVSYRPKRKVAPFDAKLVAACVEALDKGDHKAFDDVRAKAEKKMFEERQTRESGERAKKNFATPRALKVLVPSEGEISGLYICWQKSQSAFQGYYPDAPQPSTSRTASEFTGLDEVGALYQVTSFLWNMATTCHDTHTNTRPTYDMVKEALENAYKELADADEAVPEAKAKAKAKAK
eukprot:3649076-Karenia_brevis.AAC.1